MKTMMREDAIKDLESLIAILERQIKWNNAQIEQFNPVMTADVQRAYWRKSIIKKQKLIAELKSA